VIIAVDWDIEASKGRVTIINSAGIVVITADSGVDTLISNTSIRSTQTQIVTVQTIVNASQHCIAIINGTSIAVIATD